MAAGHAPSVRHRGLGHILFASFGLAMEALSHEAALPALGLATQPEDQTTRERGSEITSYVGYGVTAELVRRLVRRWL